MLACRFSFNMKGLKRHNLDFEIIPTGNSKTLVFIDSSYYYTEPEKPLLEITMPGYTKYFLVNIVAHQVNTFNSNTIGFTELLNNECLVDLPDGAYSFRFKVCPYDALFIDKKFFRTTLFDKKLAEVYDRMEATDCSRSTDTLISVQLAEIVALAEGAKAIVDKSSKKATQFYQLADTMIDRILKDLCKNCK